MDSSTIYSSVSSHYGAAALATDNANYAQTVASAFGYTAEDLEGMPAEANLGLSCGNPFAIANLKEGETVVDLGSGAGFDVFQAAKKVGQTGKAIGVDFNKDMLTRANSIKTKLNAENVTFVESQITKIDLPDASVDCIISNCVINLVPEGEKQQVFDEIFRLLRPGGRVAVSDILAKSELPEHIREDMALYVGCIAGASQVAAYEKYLRTAGFKDILLQDTKSDLNVYYTAEGGSGPCCGPTKESAPEASCGTPAATKKTVPEAKACCGPPKDSATAANGANIELKQSKSGPQVDFNEFAGSYKIYAIKP